MKNLMLAWRNIWRNKRRTLITVASIFFGVLLATLMSSMQEGTYSKMIDNVVSFYSGYMQIHHPDYWEDKTIENTFVPTDVLFTNIDNSDVINRYASRLENFTLISSGENTKGAALIGVEPEAENNITGLSKWISEGTYFTSEQKGVLVAINIATNLNVSVGDSIVLLSQGYHGVTAAAVYPIIGILDFPTSQLDNLGVYIPLKTAQTFYSAPERITSIVIMTNDYNTLNTEKHKLQKSIGDSYKVLTWDEMDPVTKQMIEGDRAQGVITKGILYILIGFGVFGTVIMMMAERKKELGVLVAIGMKKSRLALVLVYETILIGLVGVGVGFIVSIPIIQMLVSNPIPLTGDAATAYEQFGMEPAIYFGNAFGVFIDQLLIIFSISIVVAIYPLTKILKLQVTKALRG